MKKDNYSTIIDFGSSELRLGVFDKKLYKLFFLSKPILKKKNYEEYLHLIKLLIREAENKISTHLENITVLYDNSSIFTIDISIKKKLEQKIIFKEVCSSMILEANQIINNCYINKKIIHTVIKKYIINDKEFFDIPDNIPKLNSVILEIKFICIPLVDYKNVSETFKKNNLKIINFFSSSVVKSFNYIDYFKENKFVAFLDIGLDRTTIVFFVNRKLEYINSIPIGGNNISKDISQIMKLSIDEAENLKKTFNRSEIDFSYNSSNSDDNTHLIKEIIGKNISIDLLKKVVLSRIDEIIGLSFKGANISENILKLEDLSLVLIGNGSKIFDKNTFQLEDKYNFKEICFYDENDFEICKSGIIFEKNFQDQSLKNMKKYQKKLGFFHRFFNFFGND